MNKNIVFAVPLLAFLVSGCASPSKATLLGAGIGIVAGSAVGLMSYPGRNGEYLARNVIIGGALGTILGAGTGYVAHDLVEKNEREAFDRGKETLQKQPITNVTGGKQPTLIPPHVETRFVDDQVRGNIFVPAHVEYQISENARWQ